MVNVRERLVWRAWTGTGYQGWRQASCAESAMLANRKKGMMSNEGDARSRLCAAVMLSVPTDRPHSIMQMNIIIVMNNSPYVIIIMTTKLTYSDIFHKNRQSH